MLGTAILAAVASGAYPSVVVAMKSMTEAGEVVLPQSDARLEKYYAKKCEAFLLQYEHVKALQALERDMDPALAPDADAPC